MAANKMISTAAFPEISQATRAFQQIPFVFGLAPPEKPCDDGQTDKDLSESSWTLVTFSVLLHK